MNTLEVGDMASAILSISTIREFEVFSVRKLRNTLNSRNTLRTMTMPPDRNPAPAISTTQSIKLKLKCFGKKSVFFTGN